MYDLPSNTLIEHISNPLLNKFNFANISCKDFANELLSYSKNKSLVNPESDALLFYLSNHGFHLIKNKYSEFETLPEHVGELCEQHILLTQKVSQRLFTYIVLISLEEANFLPRQEDRFYAHFETNVNQKFADIVRNNNFKLENMKTLDLTCSQMLKEVRGVFDYAKWNQGFGGRPWGDIVGMSHSVVTGKLSYEMMSDLAFSLCHNNGSMFNKGKLYNMYSEFIYSILDIQASGQIPAWINENQNNKFVTPEILKLFKMYAKSPEFKNEFTIKLDKTKLNDSATKRKKAHEAKMTMLKNTTVYTNYNNNNNNNNNSNKSTLPPEAAIDTILIADFKKKKLI